jgi:uncharacterized protein YpmB
LFPSQATTILLLVLLTAIASADKTHLPRRERSEEAKAAQRAKNKAKLEELQKNDPTMDLQWPKVTLSADKKQEKLRLFQALKDNTNTYTQ